MRVQLTKQECRWIADLANKAKIQAEFENKETPHPLWVVRQDIMRGLEDKFNAAIEKEAERERRDAR